MASLSVSGKPADDPAAAAAPSAGEYQAGRLSQIFFLSKFGKRPGSDLILIGTDLKVWRRGFSRGRCC